MLNIEGMLKENYQSFYQKYPKILTGLATKFLRTLLHEDEINSFLSHTHHKGIALVEAVLESYNVSYEVKSSQVENIPALGSVVVIANHPLGGMDSLVLLKMICDARHDKKVKIIANRMLMQFDPTQELIIPVNNIDGRISKSSKKEILKSLTNDEAVIFFPSGEVSRASITGIKEEKWKAGFIKLARSANAPILPIFLDAKNSWKFYFFSAIYKPLGGLLLSHEMLNPKHKLIKATIGELIPVEAFSNRNMNLKEYTRLFKKHLYKISRGKPGIFNTQKCIAHPQPRQLLKSELKDSKLLGYTSDDKKIFLVAYDNSPTIMAEIGRLREFSFRKVGEGSGDKRDLDKYDTYYKHLVLWDDDALEIVGSYRIGESKDIIEKETQEGLYMNELCHLTQNFLDVADHAIELGRSFVQPKYWGSRALDYLWQGIGAYLRAYPSVHYLYGPVSISGSYPKAAKDALVYFFRHYFQPKEKYFKSSEGCKLEEELFIFFLVFLFFSKNHSVV